MKFSVLLKTTILYTRQNNDIHSNWRWSRDRVIPSNQEAFCISTFKTWILLETKIAKLLQEQIQSGLAYKKAVGGLQCPGIYIQCFFLQLPPHLLQAMANLLVISSKMCTGLVITHGHSRPTDMSNILLFIHRCFQLVSVIYMSQ